MVGYKDGTAVRLLSRAGKEHSRRFSELAADPSPPADQLILDGEVAIFDVSRFAWFKKRLEDAAFTPPIYTALNCLYCRGPGPT